MNFTRFFVATAVVCASSDANATAELVFEGWPDTRVTVEADGSTTTEKLEAADSMEYRAVVHRIQCGFYWASRENKELEAEPMSGIYTTFASSSGLIKAEVDERIKRIGREREARYFEVMHAGLATIIYQGRVSFLDDDLARPRPHDCWRPN